MREIQVKKADCMWCHLHCNLAVHIRDGRLEKIEEDKGNPRSAMLAPAVRACRRARVAAEWFYHPDRLNYPLKRAGGKTDWGKAFRNTKVKTGVGSEAKLNSFVLRRRKKWLH